MVLLYGAQEHAFPWEPMSCVVAPPPAPQLLHPPTPRTPLTVSAATSSPYLAEMHFPTSKEQAEVALGRLKDFFGKHLGAAA